MMILARIGTPRKAFLWRRYSSLRRLVVRMRSDSSWLYSLSTSLLICDEDMDDTLSRRSL